ncbi:MAG: thiamine pyrophosphate-binding protein [Saccharofermentans sp.]|nr:thiamine pyrophosphate-binding protein [Saccharofermentans sp.]
MKATDYIVKYLISKNVSDVFGYPGGMVTHLMESLSQHQDEIKAHLCYNEQGAAFEACGYAQTSGNIGVAYATSGPGATNLITGICDAYFDSIPTLFITGQVNTFESKTGYQIRQRGFQETDIISMVSSVTKYAHYVSSVEDLVESLDKAYEIAMDGRKGPVLLDIPMNIQRGEIPDSLVMNHLCPDNCTVDSSTENTSVDFLLPYLMEAKRPVVLLGAGVKQAGITNLASEFIAKTGYPAVTSMTGFDILSDMPNNYGFIGAYGDRAANFVVAKADLVLTIGARLDIRQAGAVRENFAPTAKIIRVDIDDNELTYKIRDNEIDVNMDARVLLNKLSELDIPKVDSSWISVCDTIREKLSGLDDRLPNIIMRKLSESIPENTVIATDVGQNQVWVAQSFKLKKGQQVLFSGGHGAMGYSLPAAIGAHFGTNNPAVSINGDGGIQMNIQELEFIHREKLPVTVVVFNNSSLGMIRHFQEMYFNGNYAQTLTGSGYSNPHFDRIASAYDMKYICANSANDYDLSEVEVSIKERIPTLVEVVIDEYTYVSPKLRYGEPNQDQEPLLDRDLYKELMEL